MKQIGGVTYIGVSLIDLNKYFKDDAVIHVSKKFLASYKMITGITETPKPISMNVIDKGEMPSATPSIPESIMEKSERGLTELRKIEESVELEIQPTQKIEKIDTAIEPVREAAPPVELNVNDGDW